jgi:hypothetical protein
MTITVTSVSNTQTFGAWLAVTNRLANIVSQNTVTADSTSGGSVTTGNSFVNGHFGANTIAVTTLKGGNLTSNATLTIQTNTAFAQSSITVTDGIVRIANTVSNTAINLTVANSTVIANGQYYLNANGSWERVVTDSAGGNTQVQFNSSNSFAGSADFTFISANTRLTLGNTSVNAAITPLSFSLANSTVSFTLSRPNTSQVSNGAFFLNANGSWSEVSGGAGYYKGNAGIAGKPENIQNLFRINANTMTANITIAAGENAQVTGPLTIANGAVLTIDSGGRVAVI